MSGRGKEVSVIVPVYNSGKTLGECIESILKQRLCDFEVLLIDDDSKDDSLRIAKKWEGKDSRIRVYSKENGGPSSARNCGIKNAAGRYLVFVDSDDWIPEDYIFNMLEVQKTYGADAWPVSAVKFCNSMPKGRESRGKSRTEILDGNEVLKLNRKVSLNSPCNKLYDRQLIQKNGILFREDVWLGEDLLFNIDYLYACNINKFVILPDNIYFYRRDNADSLSRRYYDDFFACQNMLYGEMLGLAEAKGESEEECAEYRKQYDLFMIQSLEYYMRKDSPRSFREKMKINSDILKTVSFREYVLRNKGNFPPLMEGAYRSGSYFRVWVTQWLLKKYHAVRMCQTQGKRKNEND